MTWQWTLLLVPLGLGTLLSLSLAIYIYTSKQSETSRTGALLLVAGAWWLFCSMMEMGNAELEAKVFWAHTQYLAIGLLPTIWLAFALSYTGHGHWLTRRRLVGLMIIPFIVILAVFTNDRHNLMWDPPRLVMSGSIVVLEQNFRIGFWIFLAQAILTMAIGALFFVRMFLNVRLLYRRQIRSIILSAVILTLMGVLDSLGLTPFPNVDLEPFAFTFAALIMTWGLFRLQIGDIVPVAQATIIENMVDGIIVLNANGCILDLNPIARNLLGLPDVEYVGVSMVDVGQPWSGLARRLDVADDGAVQEVTLGEPPGARTFDVRTSVLRDGRNVSIARILVLRDVTVRKRAERELLERHRHLEAVWVAVPDAIVVLNAEWRILEWNKGAEHLFGYKKREALGQNIAAVTKLPGAPEETREVYDTIWKGKQTSPVETIRYRKGGEPVHVIAAASPIIVDEKFVGAVFVFTDVTERKRAEAQVRALNEELELRVDERTSELGAVNARLAEEIAKHEQDEVTLIQRNRELLALQSAAAATSSSLDLPFLFDTVTWEMVNLEQSDGCIIYEWSPDTDKLTLVADYDAALGDNPDAEVALALSGFALRKRVLEERFAQQVSFAEADAAEQAFMTRRGIKAALLLPMAFQEHVVGLVVVTQIQPRTFTDRDIALGQLLANQAATAVENARLYERAQTEIAERVRAEATIKASLKEKEILLQEIHHRVKNNLQVISSLLNLQSQSITDTETLEVFRESQHRIRSMALIHEKLYRSQDLARVDFAEYIRNLAAFLIRSYRSRAVRLNLEAGEVFLAIDNAVPCGLIVNELISNALKHAFVDGREGEIHVKLLQEADHSVTMVVGDNGVGIPEDIDFSTTGSLGMQLVDMLVQQLDGSLEIRNNGGAEFEITFPGV